jgi:hypothetical protein
LKKGDVDNAADNDDELRTTAPSQNGATATLSTEEFLLRTQYLQLSSHISREVLGGATENRWSMLYL